MAREKSSFPVAKTGPRTANPRRLLSIVVFGVLPLVVAAAWLVVTTIRTRSGLGRPASENLLTLDRPFPASGRFVGDPYAGPKACARCHPAESALHARSGHAATLMPVSRVELTRRIDGMTVADPEQSGVRWKYKARGGRFEVARTDRRGANRWVIQYAFGSGRHATTFVDILDPKSPAIFEHRLTYYSREGRFGITPGQSASSSPASEVKPDGKELTGSAAVKCFGCHSTQLSARGEERIDEATMIPNVSCERCHGPGRAHVKRASRGEPAVQLTMPFGPGAWTAESQMMLCGTCHRHPSRAQPGQVRPDDPHLARFQPVGIMQSRCFRESRGALSCITCHDPHARASSDSSWYNSRCKTCHRGRSSGSPSQSASSDASSEKSKATTGASCPVSPDGSCVTCHMPRVDSGQHVFYTDHWIRVRDATESRTKTRAP